MTSTVPALLRRRSLVPFLLASASALLLVPAAAGAQTFCVYDPDPCAGTAEPNLQAAIDAAAPDGGGTIRVGWSAPDGPGDRETIRIGAGNAVRIRGDVLPVVDFPAVVQVGGAAPGTPPVVVDEPNAELRDVALADATTTGAPVVDLRAGTLAGVVVHATAAGATALHLGAATLREGTTVYGAATAAVADGAAATIQDSTLYGDHGLDSTVGALTLVRSAIEGDVTALHVTAGAVTADDSWFSTASYDEDPDQLARLVDVAPAPATNVSVTLRSATIDAYGLAGTGLAATCASGATADVTLTDALAVRAGTRDLAASGAGCAVHLDHVEYGTRAAASGGATYDDGAGVVARPGDTTLLERDDDWAQPSWHSPARDAGSARPLAPGETDLLGKPRVVDGARDLGALEYQHVAPVADIDGDATVPVGEEADYDDGGTHDADHEPLTEAWTLDGMPVPAFSWDDFEAPAEVPPLGQSGGFMWWTPTAPGAHRIGLTVTDPSGLSSSFHGTVTAVAATVPRPPAIVVPMLPAPQPEVPPHVAPFTEPGLRTAFLRKRRLTAAGRLQVQLACVRPTGCTGVVRVVMAGLNTNDRAVVIARLPFRLRSLQTRTYNIVLTRAARRAIVHSAGKGRRVSLVPYEGTGRRLRLVAGGANGTVRAPKRS